MKQTEVPARWQFGIETDALLSRKYWEDKYMSPKHIERVPEYITDDKGNNIPRRAVAPYNFVELPEKVVEAQPLPDQNCYHDYSEHLINGETIKIKRHTGTIKCSLTTESPLYTRCGWSPEDFAEHSEKTFKELPEEIKNKRVNFFINPATNKQVVPGSSIRGMLRTLVEIVSFSKIDRVTDNKLFYRSLGDPALKHIYQASFVDNIGQVQHSPHRKASCYQSKVHAGFLYKHKRGNSYFIKECGYGRINFDLNNPPTTSVLSNLSHNQIYQTMKKVKTPNWQYQQKTIYVDIDQSEQDDFFVMQTNRNGRQRHPDLYLRFRKVHSASFTPAAGLQKGTLVITGDMQHKHLEFVFLDEKLNEHPVSEEMVRRFQDDDQITKWQEKAYPKDKPFPACREKDGYLRDGEPVFFLLNNDNTVRFLGRAQMFRLPYPYSPLDFVPEKPLRARSQTDIAEAIFGYVDGKKPRKEAYASRVFITDAILDKNQIKTAQKTQEKKATEILLSSPKPTTFQHYLVQPKETEVRQENLKHYASQAPTDTEEGETLIRGHKLYWHKPYQNIEVPENVDSQTSLIKPIDPGIEFTFDIYFENLSDVELGVLLWVLSLSSDKSQQLKTDKTDEKYCFSLGMGKPLGMGAVKIDYELHLSDRTAHYSQLFNGHGWSQDEKEPHEVTQTEIKCISEFEKYVLDRISENDYPEKQNRQQIEHLRQIPRIEMLLAMLQCEPPPEATDYMELEKFKDRKVLPTPLDIRRIKDKRRFPTNSTTSSKTTSKPKPQKKSDRPSPSLPKKSTSQPTQEFSEGQEVDAKVVDIQVKEGQKLQTTITYEIQGSDCQAKEEIYKERISLTVGDIQKVKILKFQGKSVRRVKRI